jgi:pimeloyl-ACP methyl ester carboxylesterase
MIKFNKFRPDQLMKKLLVWLLIVFLAVNLPSSCERADLALSSPNCPIATNKVTVGNGSLSVSRVGKGAVILMLHGLFANKEQWTEVMCLMSQAGYQVIAPDLPGYGESKGFALKDYALENQATILHELMQSLGVKSLDIAGNSMGGAIAYLYAQHYPEMVQSLAFIGSPMGVIDWSLSVKNAILQGINPFIPITKEEFDLAMSLLLITPPSIPDSIKTEKINNYLENNRHYRQVWDIVNLYDDIILKSPKIQIPTLIIWGEKDRIYDLSGVSTLQQFIPEGQVFQLPLAGHLPLLENADEVTSKYLDFLQVTSTKNRTN